MRMDQDCGNPGYLALVWRGLSPAVDCDGRIHTATFRTVKVKSEERGCQRKVYFHFKLNPNANYIQIISKRRQTIPKHF